MGCTTKKRIATNIANSDTPGYKASHLKEPDFKKILNSNRVTSGSSLNTTHAKHIRPSNHSNNKFKVDYTAGEASKSGNTVSLDHEMMTHTNASMKGKIARTFTRTVYAWIKVVLRTCSKSLESIILRTINS